MVVRRHVVALLAVFALIVGFTVSSASMAGALPTPTVPAAPTSLSATPGNTIASISFTAGSSGGASITNYKYQIGSGSWTALSPADNSSPVTIPGLTNGTTYSIALRAVNSVGDGTASSAVSVTPAGAPAAPTSLVAYRGNGSAEIAFTAGSNNGGAITNYKYQINDGSWTAFSPAVATPSVTIGGLTNDTTYSVKLRAVNSVGDGSISSAVSVTPADVNALNWTGRTAPEANNWQSVTYGNGLFVAVSFDGTNRVMTSPDGITWTARSAPSSQWQSVTYGNGQFVAVAYYGAYRVMTSPDGITWTGRFAAEANSWYSVSYGNGLFVAVSFDGTNRVMTSPDGVTWTAQTAAAANQWFSVTYGNGKFVAVANDGTNRVMTSPDGVTWTARTAYEDGWMAVTYGNGNFVAVSYQKVMISTDGTTWVRRPTAASNNWRGIAYGNGKFVAVAPNTGGPQTIIMTSEFAEPTTPDAPTSLEVTIGKGSASVSFTAGADGGSEITNYEYQLNGTGAWTALSPVDTSSPVTIPGLTNGTPHTVKLRAVNSLGSGAASSASASFTPLLRLVTPAQEGTLSILAGTGSSGTPTPGPATSSALGGLDGLAVDASGNAYIADANRNKVFKITSGGTLSVFAGTGAATNYWEAPAAITPGPATSADLAGPSGLAVDSSGNLYVAVTDSRQIVKITPDGTLSIVAGTGTFFSFWPQPVLTPGPATSVDLNRPTGVAVDSAGNLYIVDTGYQQILKVTTGGTLSVVAGTGSFGTPTAGPATSSDLGDLLWIAVDSSGNLYIAESGANKVLKVTTGGNLSVFAGTGTSGLPTPGPATSSNLGTLNGIAVDSTGNVFITDFTNNLIDKITPDGTLSIAAGTGYRSSPTPGPVADSELGSTTRVATDSSGNLYMLDSSYYLLEKVSFTPPVVAPDAPTGLSATAGIGSASIAFTAGADGGASILKYQYQLGSGSWVDAVGTSSPITISGLTNGTAYTVKLRAVNTAGSGAESVASASFTPRTVPGAPTITSVTPGVSTVLVAFTVGSTGGSVITGYEYQLNGAGSWFSLGTTSSPASIGVTNGVAYTVKLRAVNVAGSGAASSASGSFTPRTVPSALTAVVATDGNGSASIAFTAGSNGGASITKYQYRLGAGSWVDAGLTSPILISGLVNFTTYSIQVRAVNAAGGGAASVAVSARPQSAGPMIGVAYSSGKQGVQVGFTFTRLPGSTPVGFTVRAYAKGTTTVVSSCQTTPSTRSCYVPSLTSGTEYDIRVQAYFTLAGETKVRSSLESATSTVRVNS